MSLALVAQQAVAVAFADLTMVALPGLMLVEDLLQQEELECVSELIGR